MFWRPVFHIFSETLHTIFALMFWRPVFHIFSETLHTMFEIMFWRPVWHIFSETLHSVCAPVFWHPAHWQRLFVRARCGAIRTALSKTSQSAGLTAHCCWYVEGQTIYIHIFYIYVHIYRMSFTDIHVHIYKMSFTYRRYVEGQRI